MRLVTVDRNYFPRAVAMLYIRCEYVLVYWRIGVLGINSRNTNADTDTGTDTDTESV